MPVTKDERRSSSAGRPLPINATGESLSTGAKMALRLAGALNYLLSRVLHSGLRVVTSEEYERFKRPVAPAQGFRFMSQDPQTAAARLKAYAATQGADVDRLVSGAASHFQTDVIQRRRESLSTAELEQLIDDDQSALGR